MKHLVLLPICLFFCLLPACLAAPATSQNLTDPFVANKLDITVQQLHSLRNRFNLTSEQILALSPSRLQRLLYQVEHPGFEKHRAELEHRMLKFLDQEGQIPSNALWNAIQHRKHMPAGPKLFPAPPDPSQTVPDPGTFGTAAAGLGTNSWTWLGPGNIGGRIRGVVIHPTSTNIMWCGGVDGGVWKTTNSGAAWFPLNDFMANLAVSCLTMDPADPNVIYAGTGEFAYNADGIRGAGIFKTADGGQTWTQLTATANSSYLYVSRISIDPNNRSNLLVSTRSGIYRSTNFAASFSQRLAADICVVQYHPTDSTKAIASGYNTTTGAYYSTDSGQTWTAATGFPSSTAFNGGRIELSYSPSNGDVVFASYDRSSGEVYRSADGGQTYTLRSTPAHLGGQGWYDNMVWCDPVNTNILIVGGTDLYRSINGGTSFTDIGGYAGSIHPDQHIVVHNPMFNGTTVKGIFAGNDGGMFRALDVYTVSSSSGWAELNNNLGITQFYGGAGNSNTTVIVGGTQDNGTLRYTVGGGTEGWTAMFGGDGGYCAADNSDANYFYGEYVRLQIHRSSNGGASSGYIYTGIAEAGTTAANFIAPFILDPNNGNTMLAGGTNLWRSTNVKAGTPTWTRIKPSTGSPISAIAVAPGNSDVIWVGHNNGGVYSTTNGTAATPTWTQRGSGTLPGRYCERITIAPGDPNRAYVTFGGFNSGNVWRSHDGGSTWSNLHNNLPTAPMNSLVVSPADTNTLYVGSEVGVFGTSNGGGTWSTGNDGPANCSVDELFWLGNKLVAVTHGRGMFYIVPNLGAANLAPGNALVTGGNGNGGIDPNECNLLNLLIQNTGGSTAATINATVTTTTPGVTIVQGNSTYPNLAPGATATNTTPFQISTSPAYACGTPVSLVVTAAFATGTNVLNYSVGSGSGAYTLTQSNGVAIVPGTTDTGNHTDDGTTAITLPFGFAFYDQVFSNATLSSNGNLQFGSTDNAFNNACLPYAGFSYAIIPMWDDLYTGSTADGQGIFTSTTGSAPNRIFNIEWRTTLCCNNTAPDLNFQIRLHENQSRIDIIYGSLAANGSTATTGIQKDAGTYSQFQCNTGGLTAGLMLTWQLTCTDGGGTCGGTNADLAITASSAPNPVTITSNLTYTLTVTNLGLAAATSVTLTDTLPAAVTFVSAPLGCTYNAGQVICDLGTLDSGAQSNLAILVTPTATGILTNTALVTTPTNEPNTANNLIVNLTTVVDIPPTITGQPAAQNTCSNATANFTVAATGANRAYQWQKNSVNLSNTGHYTGTTTSNLTVSPADNTDAANYRCLVSNTGGVATSTVAALTLKTPTSITGQPSPATVCVDSTAQFTITATGSGSLGYQWLKNGSTLADGGHYSGATSNVLTISPADSNDASNYQCVATADCGSRTSSVATLTVNGPVLLVTPASHAFGSLATGTAAQTTFVVTNTGCALLTGTASAIAPFTASGAFSVAAGAKSNITVTFTPTAASNYTGNVTFTSNGGNTSPSLTGTGYIPVPQIIGTGATLTAETCLPTNGVIDAGETVTVDFALRNIGAADTVNLIATLPGSTPQNYGVLIAGGSPVSRSFTFTPTNNCGTTLTTLLQLQDGPTNLGTITNAFTIGTISTVNFSNSNTGSITIPGSGNSGPATPYPSTITMSSVTGAVVKVTVTLNSLSHARADNLDILLVGPGGQTAILMSDAGGANALSSVTLTFDTASNALPTTAISSGTYAPTDYTPGDTFNSPAPAGPHTNNLTLFNGVDPNGTWSLYLMDDANPNSGSLANGWKLNLTTTVTNCCTTTAAQLLVTPATYDFGYVPTGVVVQTTLTATNLGQSPLTGTVNLAGNTSTQVLANASTPTEGPFTNQIIFTTTGGDSTNLLIGIGATVPIAAFTATPTNGLAPLLVNFTDLSTGTITNWLWDFGDGNTTNVLTPHTFTGTNDALLIVTGPLGISTSAVVTITATNLIPTADLAITQTAFANLVTLGDTVTLSLLISNFGFATATSVTVTDALPANVTFVSASPACVTNGDLLICNFATLASNAATTVTFDIIPTLPGILTNTATVTGAEPDPVPADNASTFVITVPTDADGDGIPDPWELTHGLNPHIPGDAALDPDGDGLTSLQEYLAGTDPQLAASSFRVAAVQSQTNGFLIIWRAGGGTTNIVQRTAALTNSFLDISAPYFIPVGSEILTNHLDEGAQTNGPIQFYRIRLLP